MANTLRPPISYRQLSAETYRRNVTCARGELPLKASSRKYFFNPRPFPNLWDPQGYVPVSQPPPSEKEESIFFEEPQEESGAFFVYLNGQPPLDLAEDHPMAIGWWAVETHEHQPTWTLIDGTSFVINVLSESPAGSNLNQEQGSPQPPLASNNETSEVGEKNESKSNSESQDLEAMQKHTHKSCSMLRFVQS